MTEIYGDKKDKTDQKDWEQKLAKHVADEWTRGKDYCTEVNYLYDDLYDMFRGERPDKNYDWQSDFSLNKTFQVVWKAVSYTIKKIYGANPVIGVEGFDQKGCWQREIMLEKWMSKDASFLKTVMGLIRLYLNGVVYIRKTWEQEIETLPNGKQFPKADKPHDIVANNKDVVVDWLLQPGQSCREGRFVIYRQVVDVDTLYTSRINYINLDKIDTEAVVIVNEDHSLAKSKDSQETPPDDEIYAETDVYERQGLWPVKIKEGKYIPVMDAKDVDDTVEYVQMVVTIANKENPVLIRWEPNPYGEMTWIDSHLYFDLERHASMGMIEPAKDIFSAQDDNINAIFDQKNQNLMPPVLFNKYAPVEWDTIQYAPQQKWMIGGNPNDVVAFTKPSNVTGDAWATHQLLDSEGQATTSITPAVEGMGKEKTATMGVLNVQFSVDKLDFFILMIEHMWLRPSAEMNMRFYQRFGHPMTAIMMLGEPLQFDQWADEYKYQPVASSVKMDQQKEKEIQEDIQLMQIVQAVPNPNTPKVLNYLLANILRNRNKPHLAKEMQLDENYFEPGNQGGTERGMMGGQSNQNQIPMSTNEASVREGAVTPRRMLN